MSIPTYEEVILNLGVAVHAVHVGFLTFEGAHVGQNTVFYGGAATLSLGFLLLLRETLHKRRHAAHVKAVKNVGDQSNDD